jgi:ABC-2 type transport system ATP-binding protein
VSRWFGSVVAVSDINVEIGAGVTSLLGPNGAGKSTLLRVIAGLIPPSQGQVRVLDADPRVDREVRRRIGLVPQQDALFEKWSAFQGVLLAAALHEADDPATAARRALDRVDLDSDETRPVSGYSKGMRQRVKVAMALAHEPDVLLLDEPLTGMDPLQRRASITLYRELGDSGITVLISSHVLDEVARIGSDVVVISQGRLAATGDFHSLRELMDDRPHQIRIRSDDPRLLATALLSEASTTGVQISGADVLVNCSDADAFGRAVAPLARNANVSILDLRPVDDDLESVFRYLVERR